MIARPTIRLAINRSPKIHHARNTLDGSRQLILGNKVYNKATLYNLTLIRKLQIEGFCTTWFGHKHKKVVRDNLHQFSSDALAMR